MTALGDRARELVAGYQARTGLSRGQVGALVGLAYQTMSQFASNCYPHDEDPIARRIIAWIEANPPEIPAPPGKLYDTANVRLLRAQISRALAGEHSLIYGSPGTQKTFVFEHCVAEAVRRDGLAAPSLGYIYASDAMRPRSLLAEISRALVCFTSGTAHQILTNLIYTLRRRSPRPALIIDEAQHLRGNLAMLEILREIADRARIGLILAGHDDLEQMFDPQHSPLEQWVSRIDYRLRLPGLSEKEVREIVQAELGPLSERSLDALLAGCQADDRQTRSMYFSARYLFKAIAQIRERRARGRTQ